MIFVLVGLRRSGNFLPGKELIRNVTSLLHESRLLWIHDPHRSQPSRVPPSHPPASPKNNSVPRTNHTMPRTNHTVPRSNQKVPRNSENAPRNSPIAQSSDVRVRAPLENIPSSVWHNSAISSRSNDCPPVPRNNMTDEQINPQKTVSPTPKKKRNRFYRRDRRARERAEKKRHLIMMRGGPLRAQELLPVPLFQTD